MGRTLLPLLPVCLLVSGCLRPSLEAGEDSPPGQTDAAGTSPQPPSVPWSRWEEVKSPSSEDPWSVSLSADGNVLAIGGGPGTVTLFRRSDRGWNQEALLRGSPDSAFGVAVALSADGRTLAVGDTRQESSGGFSLTGAVSVFRDVAGTWAQEAFLEPSNGAAVGYAASNVGFSVTLNADGTTLAVGAPSGRNDASGDVFVFGRRTNFWTQDAALKAPVPSPGDAFGWSVSLDARGTGLAVGAVGSKAIDGMPSGAVYVFQKKDAWTADTSLKVSNTRDFFGTSVSLSANGTTLAIGAEGEDSNAGAVYVFRSTDTSWRQETRLEASRPNVTFGNRVSLSANGSTLAAANWHDGVVYVYQRQGMEWTVGETIMGVESRPHRAVSLWMSADGTLLAVGYQHQRQSADDLSAGTVRLVAR